uniref:Chromosome 7 open reading frame 57 n=1 Tax=Bubo bubo TaxID=30461 RepID=A0A8C0G587_BUBBB
MHQQVGHWVVLIFICEGGSLGIGFGCFTNRDLQADRYCLCFCYCQEKSSKNLEEQWIKETDSAYYRLAKQGDLRKHYTPATMKSSPAAYATPDWYSHCSNPALLIGYVSSLPDYMIQREFKADDHRGNSYKTRGGPFDFDMKSVWQRDAEDKENTEKKKVKLPAINPKYPSRMPNVSSNKEFSGKNKLSFPPVPPQRKSEAVNFSKLISNGYGTDWFQHFCDTLGLLEFIFVFSINISTIFFVRVCAEPLPPGEYQKKTGKQKTGSCVLLFRRKTAVKLK